MARIALIPGDGIGKEVVPVGVAVLEVVARCRGLDIGFEWLDYGADRYLRDGIGLPEKDLHSIAARCQAIFLGAVGDARVPDQAHAREIVLGTRQKLDLYVNLRPCKLLDTSLTPLRDKSKDQVRFVVFRENTEGEYIHAGGFLKKGGPDEVAVDEAIHTRRGVERIQVAACEYAVRNGLRRVCMSDKSNALRFGNDLWMRTWREVSARYPGIQARHLYIDVLAMELVRKPEAFDVIVTTNLFGDIISDLGAGLVGGLGLAASANVNPERGIGMFEPVHGSAPDIAGKGIANPLAAVATAALMLEHLGHDAEARAVEASVEAAVLGRHCTPDLGGTLSTKECGEWVAADVAARLAQR
jgi:3-isopropylmalate dehydrogenase